jgi:hypothetical protein
LYAKNISNNEIWILTVYTLPLTKIYH